MDKKISVIIPVYNAEKYLRQTLESVRCRTYENLEIICVLDSPTDGSEAIVREIAEKDSRVKLVRHEKNLGLPAARNTGVANASGEYMHFLDSDDLINPCFYEVMVNAAVDADADVTACSVFYEKKPAYSLWFRKNDILTLAADKIVKSEVAVYGWAVRYLIRRNFWTGRGLSFPNLVPMEDKPVMVPMIYYANKVVLCPDAVYFYKNRTTSILNRRYSPEQEKIRSGNRQKARKIIRDFAAANKIKLPNRLLRLIKMRFT